VLQSSQLSTAVAGCLKWACLSKWLLRCSQMLKQCFVTIIIIHFMVKSLLYKLYDTVKTEMKCILEALLTCLQWFLDMLTTKPKISADNYARQLCLTRHTLKTIEHSFLDCFSITFITHVFLNPIREIDMYSFLPINYKQVKFVTKKFSFRQERNTERTRVIIWFLTWMEIHVPKQK